MEPVNGLFPCDCICHTKQGAECEHGTPCCEHAGKLHPLHEKDSDALDFCNLDEVEIKLESADES